MSGHSKWSNIKHRKEKSDAQRGKIFTKLGREIVIAVKEGGSADPAVNSRLADVVAKAKANNMPNDNITRSIKKAAGESEGVNYEEITYEGYAPGGVAVLVSAVTDNRNRTAADIRHIFDKNGGSLGATGCVAWMFDRVGQLVVEENAQDPDEMMMLALDAGASDFEAVDGAFILSTDPNEFGAVRAALSEAGLSFMSAQIEMNPQNTVAVGDVETAAKIAGLLEKLEEHDDVQDVYHNADLPDEEA